MNDNNDPQSNVAFNTNTSSDTQAGNNPFTGDLKGEFSSDFGTNTNAVSQIFKSGSFSSENRTKYIIIGAIVLLALGAVAFFMTSSPDDPFADEFADEVADDIPEDAEGIGEDELADLAEGDDLADVPDGTESLAEETQMEEGAMMEETMPMQNTGTFQITSPPDGARRGYDETAAAAEFTWEGAADRINFSRSPSMQPLAKSVPLNGATFYAFDNPYPGTWYWQVVNAEGASEVRMFRITAPERRSFPISQPQSGGQVSGNGGVVSWQAGERIARYSVEVVGAGGSWVQPQYRFGTSGTSIALQGVSPGTYDIRVGAFSEVSGRWEWQYIKNVTVQ